MSVEVHVLGPVEATDDGEQIALGPPQQRAVLALVVLARGDVVPTATLIDALWPDDPPATAVKTIQTYVSRLRRLLGNDAIERRSGGYALGALVATDISRFERLEVEGRVEDALELWRGSALSDVRSSPALELEAARLDEVRLRALEEKLELALAEGRPRDVIGDARALAAEHPLRERLVALLMRALYGAGRQAEALEAYRTARNRLSRELGLEPSSELKELERRILDHDPSLLPPPEHERALRREHFARGRRTWRPRVAAAAAVATIAVLAVIVVDARRSTSSALVLGPNTIVRIDPANNRIVQSFKVGRLPGAIVATEKYVWVVNERDGTLSRVSTATGARETIGGLPSVGFLALDGAENVYASGWDAPFVWKINPQRVVITRRFRVRSRAIGLAVGGGSLWVVDRLVNEVARIDLRTARFAGSVPVGTDPLATTFGFGALWVANSDDGTVSVIRPGVRRPETVEVLSRPFGIAAGEGAVWAGSNTWSTISRIDHDTRRVVARIGVARSKGLGSDLYAVAAGAGSVWGANWGELTVVRVDPGTNRVVARIKMPGAPRGIAIAGDDVWVSVAVPGAEFP